MAAKLYYTPFIPAFNGTNAAPAPGAQALFYVTATTTKSPPYTDATLVTQLANPVIADAAGRFPAIYLNDTITYRVRLLDAAGVQIGTDIDPYTPGSVVTGSVGPAGATGPTGPAGPTGPSTTVTLTGDVTGTGTGSFVATIAAAAVTLAKQANLPANTIQGNNTGAAATPIALTNAQATAMINTFTSTLPGLAPLSGGGITTFLRADGTWQAPANSGGGTVNSVSVTTANGVSGTVATATTTPAITLTLGAITPTTIVASSTISGSNLSGTNTGDQNLAPYATLVSPTLTGTPAAPTAAAATNTTQIATTAFVTAADIVAGRAVVSAVSASFTVADTDNNTHKTASGATQTLTLGSITAGVGFTLRFTTAWTLAIAGGLSKNGAAPAAVTTGSVAANSLITFLHEGAGVWLASGSGLT